MAYRADPDLNRTAYGTAILSVLASLAGGWLAIANPQFYSRADLQLAHSAGVSGETIPAQFRDPRIRLGGVLLSIVGLAGVGISAMLATEDPRTLAPAAVDVDGDGLDIEPDIAEPEIVDLVAECQRLLNGFIAENPPIKAAMAARCLIIWGDQGAGKTLLADQLVTWRQVRRGDRVIVCNPHYHHDKENQLYASADEVLGTAQTIRQCLPKLLAEALATPRQQNGQKNTQRVSIVLEEFSNWHTLYNLGDLSQQVIFSASQDLRKSILNLIIPAHGLEKGMLGGESMDSGRTARLLDQSVVLKLETEPSLDDAEDDPEWTGKGEISPRGAAYQGGQKLKFQLPGILGPDKYPSEFAPYFRAAAAALRPEAETAESEPTAEERLADAAGRWAAAPNPTPAISTSIKSYSVPTPTAGATLNGSRDDWTLLYEIDKAEAFCSWLVRRDFRAGEPLPISKLRDDWGKVHFDNTDTLVHFLATVNAYGLGAFDNPTEPKQWALKIPAEDILLPQIAEAQTP